MAYNYAPMRHPVTNAIATKGWWQDCPAHADKEWQLMVVEFQDGSATYKCGKGCSGTAILKAIEAQESAAT